MPEDLPIYIFIVIILIVLFTIKPNLEFLTAKSGYKVFKKHYLCHFMKYTDCENMFKDFTNEEIIKIKKLHKSSPLANKRFSYIKINDPRNWPFTVDDYIVLPEQTIKQFDQELYNKIITHEYHHLIQRKNQRKFNKYYEAIGFIKVPEYRISTRDPLMHNPDDQFGVRWIVIIDPMKYAMPAMVNNEQRIIELAVNDSDGFYTETQSWPFNESPYTAKIKNI